MAADKKERIHAVVRLPTDLHDTVMARIKHMGIGFSEFVRRAICQDLGRRHSADPLTKTVNEYLTHGEDSGRGAQHVKRERRMNRKRE